MNDVRVGTVICYVDRDRDAFAHAQNRAGDLPVIADGVDHDPRGDLKLARCNAQYVVHFLGGPLCCPGRGGAGNQLVRERDA
jgi:hypothetical protein